MTRPSERKRFVRRPEIRGSLTEGQVGFLDETNVRRQSATLVRSQAADDGAERGPINTRREAGRQYLAVMIAGRVKAANDGQLVGDLRLERHQLAKVDAGHIGLDGLEFAANLDRERPASCRTGRCGSARRADRP